MNVRGDGPVNIPVCAFGVCVHTVLLGVHLGRAARELAHLGS